MKYFDMPADYKLGTIDKYYELNNKYSTSKVYETYGECMIDGMGSGRARDMVPRINLKGLEEYIKYSQNKNIGFNYTLNATCLGNKELTEEGAKEIYRMLKDLYEAGVSTITVAIPPLIELIKMSPYPFEIKVSTLSQISNANKAMAYKKMGVDRIVLDECMNRDFANIRRIREVFGEKCELIVNVICHKNCIYRPFHQNQCSHDNSEEKRSSTYYSHRCMQKRLEEYGNLLRIGWIRPEDLHLYSSMGIEYFKIQGRHTVLKGDPVRMVECYMQERYEGNLLDLLDCFAPTNSFKFFLDNSKLDGYIKPFYEEEGFCINNCAECNYCEQFARNAVKVKEAEEIKQLGENFYMQYDELKANSSNAIHFLDIQHSNSHLIQCNDSLHNLSFDFDD